MLGNFLAWLGVLSCCVVAGNGNARAGAKPEPSAQPSVQPLPTPTSAPSRCYHPHLHHAPIGPVLNQSDQPGPPDLDGQQPVSPTEPALSPEEIAKRKEQRRLRQEEWERQERQRREEQRLYWERVEREREEELRRQAEAQRQAQKAQAEMFRASMLGYFSNPSSVPSEDQIPFRALVDEVSAKWLEKEARAKSDHVFIAVGNPYQPCTPEISAKLLKILQELRENSLFVYYDADSMAAPMIEREIPIEMRMGISGRAEWNQSHILSIQNPYLRMMGILDLNHIVVSPDSPLSVGLLLQGESTYGKSFFAIDQEEALADGLAQWEESLVYHAPPVTISMPAMPSPMPVPPVQSHRPNVENLGIHYSKDHGMLTRSKSGSLNDFIKGKSSCSFFSFGGSEVPERKSFSFEAEIRGLNDGVIIELFKKVLVYSENYNQSMFAGKSAAVFGSARGSAIYEQEVRNAISDLASRGYGIATGGGGGFMGLANSVAIHFRVSSLGISLGGESLRYERVAMTHLHNRSLSVSGYEHRIPLLIWGRDKVIVVPGGDGTMRELATTFVHLSSPTNAHLEVRFVGQTYYSEFMKWLKNLKLPEQFLSKVSL